MSEQHDMALRDVANIVRPARMAALAGAELQQFRLRAVYKDCLSCIPFDGTTAQGATVLVAMSPWARQYSRWGTKTYEYVNEQLRTATLDVSGYTEVEVIVPAYETGTIIDEYGTHTGEIIYAARGIIGGTGVTYEGEDVEWLELNIRGWCKRWEA